MRPGRVVLVVIGALAALVGFGLAAAGATLALAHATQRDSAGFFTTDSYRLQSPAYAVTSERIDLRSDVPTGKWGPVGPVGTVRITTTGNQTTPVFVGIGPEAAVARYLQSSARDELVDVSFAPFRATYRHRPGEVAPNAPRAETFWAASAVGAGTQTLTWDVEEGRWAVVIMNADATPGVAADVSVGIQTGLLLPVGLGLAVAGILALALAAVMLIVGLRRDPSRAGGKDPLPSVSESSLQTSIRPYPARLDGRLDVHLSRWLWLVKWLLVVPHVVVLAFLWLATAVLTVVAGVAILFTGRYPRSIFDFNVGVMRWTWRVWFYALGGFATDRYPPFSLQPDPSYPAEFVVEYPERLSRGLVLVKWWLLVLPHYLIVSVFAGGWAFGDDGPWQVVGSGGLIGIVALIAGVILAVRGRYPTELFDLVMGLNRWCYRVLAYAALMRDEYPPFRLDLGGSDPGTPTPAPPLSPSSRSGELAPADR